MKHLPIVALLLIGSIFFPLTAQAQTYVETVEKINYTHSVQLGGDQPFYAAKDIGSSSPQLQVYIWADLDSQYSQQFLKSVFPTLLEKYGDEARFSYFHRSFVWENSSMMSGIMGECAALQGRFWENVPVIIANGNSTPAESLIGVNQSELKECLKNPRIKQIVDASNNDAEYIGIKGIPTIIIENLNQPTEYDRKINGNQSLAIFDQAFQEALNGEATDQDVENIKQQLVDLETAIQNTQAKVDVVEAEQSRLSREVERLMNLVQSILNSFRGLLGGNS